MEGKLWGILGLFEWESSEWTYRSERTSDQIIYQNPDNICTDYLGLQELWYHKRCLFEAVKNLIDKTVCAKKKMLSYSLFFYVWRLYVL